MNPIKPTDETFKAHLLFVLKAVGNQTNKRIEVQHQRRAVSDVSSHQPKNVWVNLVMLKQHAGW